MAFQPTGLSSEELNLHKDHSRLITGTGAAVLLGHGYREEGDVSHMDSILRLYGRMRGEGVARKKSNRAMDVGIELEPVAFDHLKDQLQKNQIEGYENILTFDALAGMRLDDTDGKEFGYGANIDAPLVHAVGEKKDPITGDVLPMAAYAAKWARLEKDRQSIMKSNELRRAMAEVEMAVPENPLPEPPFAGVGDLKATMQYDVRLEIDHAGPYPGWIVQLHHYNAALKAKNIQNGYDPDDYPNALMIGHLYTGDMQTHVHPVPFDPKLETEIFRRSEIFLQCIKSGISPDSPSMKAHFRPFPVKTYIPEAKLASIELEEKLTKGFAQLDYCNSQIDHWTELKGSTEEKLKELYEDEIDKPGQQLFANEREMQFKGSMRETSQINRDAVDGVINAAADSRLRIQEAMELLAQGNADEALAALKEVNLTSLPANNVRSIDAYEVPIKKQTAARLSVKNTKKAAKVYSQLCARADREIPEQVTSMDNSSSRASKASDLKEAPRDQSSKAEDQAAQSDSEKPLTVPPALLADAPRSHHKKTTPGVQEENKEQQSTKHHSDPQDIQVKPKHERIANPFSMS